MVEALFLAVLFLSACLAVNMCFGFPEEPKRAPRQKTKRIAKKKSKKKSK